MGHGTWDISPADRRGAVRRYWALFIVLEAGASARLEALGGGGRAELFLGGLLVGGVAGEDAVGEGAEEDLRFGVGFGLFEGRRLAAQGVEGFGVGNRQGTSLRWTGKLRALTGFLGADHERGAVGGLQAGIKVSQMIEQVCEGIGVVAGLDVDVERQLIGALLLPGREAVDHELPRDQVERERRIGAHVDVLDIEIHLVGEGMGDGGGQLVLGFARLEEAVVEVDVGAAGGENVGDGAQGQMVFHRGVERVVGAVGIDGVGRISHATADHLNVIVKVRVGGHRGCEGAVVEALRLLHELPGGGGAEAAGAGGEK